MIPITYAVNVSVPITYTEWCKQYDCNYANCPDGCEKPQPFVGKADGKLYCGCCWFQYGAITEMVPCEEAKA